MSASPSFEAGARPARTEFVRETVQGVTPDNPAWNRFSDVVLEFDPDHGADPESLRGRGDPDSQGPFQGTESPSVSITYYLQQKTSSGNTLLDGSGNPNDAVTDGLQRDADNRLLNWHTIVDRIEQSSISAGNAWGSTSRDTRQYWVCKGGGIDEPTLTGDPEDPLPTQVELDYEFEKVRHYQIDQPTSTEEPIELWVTSTDNNDSGTVTVQGTDTNDANQEEDISLSGTSDVQSTNTYKTVDAVDLSAEQAGNVEVYVDDGTGTAKGDLITTIYGQSAYDHGEGDLGVPALGSGSHASAIGQSYELYHDDTVEQPSGTTIADNFGSTAFTVSNNISGENQGGTPRRSLSAGDREVTVDVSVWGETEVQTRVSENLRSATGNVRWTMEGGHVQADSADPREVDPDALSAGESKLTTDISFSGQGLTVSA